MTELPTISFAFPGALRDALVASVLSGRKTATAALFLQYSDDPLPTVGQRSGVLDSYGDIAGVVETTSVEIVPLREVPLRHALDEGEDYTSVEQWRRGHESFWHSTEMRELLGDPTFAVHDGTEIVLERFQLVPPGVESSVPTMRTVRAAYTCRADEYARVCGTMESVHPSDKHLVTTWSTPIDGVVIDAGCGPGHWTDHLAGLGCDARGIDPTPAFIERARSSYPNCRFDIGRAEHLDTPSSSVAGILAWYSLIHHDPAGIHRPLEEFGRALQPGGTLLIGFFEGREFAPFDHAVVTAYRWPIAELSEHIERAGLDIVETHTRSGLGSRPHGAIVAAKP